jgi:hypothetical protein
MNKNDNRLYSIQELDDMWKNRLFTIDEIAQELNDGDVLQGWSAEIWKTAAKDIEEYRAGNINGKELEARREKLFSEENKIEGLKEEIQKEAAQRRKEDTGINTEEMEDDEYQKYWDNRFGDLWKQTKAAQKAGYIHGVCECIAAIGNDHMLGKKLLTEMNLTKDMAKKYANPETFKILEQGIFASKPEQKLEQTQGIKR